MLLSSAVCTGKPIPNYQACLDSVSQKLPFCNPSLNINDRVNDLLNRLTLSEKIGIISPVPSENTCECHTYAVPRLGISEWMWLVETNTNIASQCVAVDKCATTFSGPEGMGASFNRTSWFLKGSVFGTEMRALSNVNWHRSTMTGLIGTTGYGPNINIARDPRFGRNSELPGEDPFLSGTYAAMMVQGMQEQDKNGHPKMLAYLKHFTAYSTESNRGHDSYNISMHDFWETYLPQYKIGFLQGNASGVMCSYNAENGYPSCANDYILNQVLRQQWSQDALVTTDCGAISNLMGEPINAPTPEHAVAFALNNGTDIEMGSDLFANYIESAISKNLTSEAVVTTAARRALLAQFKLGRFDPVDQIEWTNLSIDAVNSTRHQLIQFEAALQSLVLLKNENNFLPLQTGKTVAVLGPQAVAREGLLSDYAADQICYNNYDCIQTIGEGIQAANFGGNTVIASGVDVDSNDSSRIAAALALASSADVIVLALGIDRTVEHEGQDRTDTALPGLQESFALQALALGKPTIIILTNGGALAIDNLINGPKAIIEAFNPSVAGSRAIGETLFGKYNKFGKLPITMYPHNYIEQQSMINYDMSIAPGRTYKYYNGSALYPFGFGLSYTTFDLQCAKALDPDYYTFQCNITNTGKIDGDEVVLVFHNVSDEIRQNAGHPIPLKSLIEFERFSIPAGKMITKVFQIPKPSIEVVNSYGENVIYTGAHQIIFTNGVNEVQSFDIVILCSTASNDPNCRDKKYSKNNGNNNGVLNPRMQ
eukprot:c18858_g1_i1.p1 GENE.c18858_g1_i1~~c18858_g1_i1.p1  ORF type:complete len:767 (-),score=379.05 c18858_g1_i1:13-2313(-)